MQTNNISVHFTQKYYTLGNKENPILLLLHGYGQNGKDFLNEFKYLSKSYFLISPNAPHAFYLKSTYGKVGYSWMTSENREDAIQNYITYLKSILERHSQSCKAILGFSQGSQTAFRLASSLNDPIDIISCSGFIPNEIKLNDWKGKITILYDENDKYLEGYLDEFQKLLSTFPIITHKHSLQHKVDHHQLIQILDN